MPIRLLRRLRSHVRRWRDTLRVALNGASLLLRVLRTTFLVADVMASGLLTSLTLRDSVPRGRPLATPPLRAAPQEPAAAAQPQPAAAEDRGQHRQPNVAAGLARRLRLLRR